MLKLTISLSLAWLVAACGVTATEKGVSSTQPAPPQSTTYEASVEGQLPNIIYILADDLGYGDLGVYGQSKIQTPNLDRMAADGMLFTQHYSGSTVCAPSRSALMTGRHTGNTQIRGNAGARKNEAHLAIGTQTIGTVLQEAGYFTGTVGKWGLGTYEDDGAPNKQGMDYFYGYIDQVKAHNYYPEYLIENGDKQMLDNGGISMHPTHVPIKGKNPGDVYHEFIGKDYAAYLMGEKVDAFIRNNAQEPFFLYYATTIPHAALQIPDEELRAYEFPEVEYKGGYYPAHPRSRAARAAMISLLDRQVGEIIATVEELGIGENTLIIFTSDNGPANEGSGSVDFFKSTGGFTGGKRDLTEGGIRVPMIAYWPGKIVPGSVSEHVSAMWDFLPTAAELAGAPLTASVDGVSFLPALLGNVDQQQPHGYLYWEFHSASGGGPAQAVRMGDWKGIRFLKGVDYVHYTEVPITLYDLAADPKENRDTAAEHPEVVARIMEIMASRKPSGFDHWNFQP